MHLDGEGSCGKVPTAILELLSEALGVQVYFPCQLHLVIHKVPKFAFKW